jgi:S1-C subfamily serine protease
MSDLGPFPGATPPRPAQRPTGPTGSTGRGWLASALVGGVVGALVTGGLFVAFDDGGDTTTIVRSSSPEIVSRPATELGGDETDIASIIAKAEPAIVAITTGDGPGSGNGGAGTGFVLSADGFIVTNNHVVEDATKIEAAFTNGDIEDAEIVGNDPSTDLAVVKVERSDLTPIELGDSEGAQVGDEVVAIGNALALEGGLSVTRGIISGTNRTVETNVGGSLLGMVQTDAAINPGNSGGPLLDASGRVIGINTAIANPASAQNVGFAIPISKAQPIIEDLRLGRAAAFLGVTTDTVTPALARERELAVDSGALVLQVTEGTPADDAGIEVGDVIVEIGGEPIEGSGDVPTAIRSHRPGDSLTVVLNRDGERVEVEAILTERPAS